MNSFAPFPFLRFSIALIVGIAGYFYLDFYQPWLWAIAAGTVLVFGILYLQKQSMGRSPFTGMVGLIFLVQIGYLLAYIRTPANSLLHYTHYLNNTHHYEAVINTLVEEKANTWKAIAEVKTLVTNQGTQPTKGQVLLYFDKKSIARPHYGDVFLIKRIPQVIESPKNPYQFDYQRYLSQQGVYRQHYVKDSSCVKIGNEIPNVLLNFAYKANTLADSLITKAGGNVSEYGVANAMILGLRDDLDADLMQAYSAAGAIHVLSVSGLHVGVIYVVLMMLFARLQQKKILGKWTVFSMVIGILWFYALVTGLSSPVLRSTFMFSLILLAQTINREHNAYNTVAFSAFCLLVYNPYFLVNVGFQLSYLAVFGMILIQPLLNPMVQIDKNKNLLYWLIDRLWKVSTVAIAAQIATFPITIYYFHQFPNWFLLANPIVILLSSVALCLGLAYLFLAYVPVLGVGVAYLLNGSVWLLNQSVLWVERLPFAITKWLYVYPSEMILMYFLIFLLLALWFTQRFIYLKISTLLLVFLIVFNLTEPLWLAKQQILVVHAIAKHTVISMIDGRKARLIADANFLASKKDIRYNLSNFWAAKGITDTTHQVLDSQKYPDFELIVWQGKSFLLLKSSMQRQRVLLPNFTVDYLIVTNKSVRTMAQLEGIKTKHLILDASNGFYQSNKLFAQAKSQGIDCQLLNTTGALVLEQ
jgi:competence protein ComEC